MTINKLPNQDDVLNRAGFVGYGPFNMHGPIADELSTQSSGGAVVSTGTLYGVRVGNSATAGNDASVIGPRKKANPSGYGYISTLVTKILFSRAAGTTDVQKIGWVPYADISNDEGAVLEISNGSASYAVNATTAAATAPPEDEIIPLTIIEDIEAGATTFEQGGAVNESVTIDSTAIRSGCLGVGYESNGNGDELWVQYMKTDVVV